MLSTHIKQTIIHKALSTGANYLRQVANATQPDHTNIYVDLDNLLGNFKENHYSLYKNIITHIDDVMTEIAKDYSKQVTIYIYGNLKYHELTETEVDTAYGKISYKDTPVINGYGKTSTDLILAMDVIN